MPKASTDQVKKTEYGSYSRDQAIMGTMPVIRIVDEHEATFGVRLEKMPPSVAAALRRRATNGRIVLNNQYVSETMRHQIQQLALGDLCSVEGIGRVKAVYLLSRGKGLAPSMVHLVSTPALTNSVYELFHAINMLVLTIETRPEELLRIRAKSHQGSAEYFLQRKVISRKDVQNLRLWIKGWDLPMKSMSVDTEGICL